jgi:hypothetical protein
LRFEFIKYFFFTCFDDISCLMFVSIKITDFDQETRRRFKEIRFTIQPNDNCTKDPYHLMTLISLNELSNHLSYEQISSAQVECTDQLVNICSLLKHSFEHGILMRTLVSSLRIEPEFSCLRYREFSF